MSATQKAYDDVQNHITQLNVIQDKINELYTTLERHKDEFNTIITLNSEFNKEQNNLLQAILKLQDIDKNIIKNIEALKGKHNEIIASNNKYIESLKQPTL